jgi:phosphate transport system substrate-binding protein
MLVRNVRAVAFFLLASVLPSFAHHLAVVVNKDNPAEEVSSANLSRIFKGELRKWSDGKMVVIILHKDSAVETLTLEHLNKVSAAEWKNYLAAHPDAFQAVQDDEAALATVESTPGAVGLVDVRSINDRVKVLKVDGKLPLEAGYLPH